MAAMTDSVSCSAGENAGVTRASLGDFLKVISPGDRSGRDVPGREYPLMRPGILDRILSSSGALHRPAFFKNYG